MQTITDQQIQIINSNRSAKSTDRYLDSKGNIWVGAVSGRLVIPPIAEQINQPGNELNLEQRLSALESKASPSVSGSCNVFFNDEDSISIVTIPSTLITNSNFKSFSVVNIETSETSLDDFTLNAVTFGIEKIIDNTSFDIRGSSVNGASGTYSIKYTVLYS